MYCRYISGVVIFSFFLKGLIPALLKALAQVLLNYTDSRPIPAFLKALEQVLPMLGLSKVLVQAFQKRQYRLYSHFHKGCHSAFKNAGTGFESAGIGPHNPSPHSKSGGLMRREKKRRDRNFDPIPALFGAIPTLFKMLGQSPFFVVEGGGCFASNTIR